MCLMKNISLEKFSRRYMHEYQWRVIVEWGWFWYWESLIRCFQKPTASRNIISVFLRGVYGCYQHSFLGFIQLIVFRSSIKKPSSSILIFHYFFERHLVLLCVTSGGCSSLVNNIFHFNLIPTKRFKRFLR
jgi:hypothetical protein